MNVGDFKELYNNLDVDYDRIQLYYKNCTELKDWYYNQLINIYIENEELPIDIQKEECHGTQEIPYFKDSSIEKINIFENKLKKILNDKFNNNYNSTRLIN